MVGNIPAVLFQNWIRERVICRKLKSKWNMLLENGVKRKGKIEMQITHLPLIWRFFSFIVHRQRKPITRSERALKIKCHIFFIEKQFCSQRRRILKNFCLWQKSLKWTKNIALITNKRFINILIYFIISFR